MASGELIFFGTPAFCLPFLEELAGEFRLSLIITQPDRPCGRRLKLTPPAVKTYALEKSIPFRQPDKLSAEGPLADELRALKPELGVVLSYGRIIPRGLFSLPARGTVNLHFSLLPELRGAAPVQRAIEKGLTRTGLTVFAIEEQLDSGPIWKQLELEICPDETSADFMRRILPQAASFLCYSVREIISGRALSRPQDHRAASTAPRLEKEEGLVDWSLPALVLYNRWRAFYPWPGLYFSLYGRTVQLLRVKPAEKRHGLQPGTVIGLDQETMRVACGADSLLEISSLQPAGKKAMSAHAFSLGNPLPRILN